MFKSWNTRISARDQRKSEHFNTYVQTNVKQTNQYGLDEMHQTSKSQSK